MKNLLPVTLLFITSYVFAQPNSFPSTGNVGIGTTSPTQSLHIQRPQSHPYIYLDKESSSYESGIAFLKAGVPNFYFFSDNADNDALKIEAAGLVGEHDLAPRISLPFINKNILLALSGGNVGIGTSAPSEALEVAGKIRVSNTQIWDNEINRYNNDNLYIGYRNTLNTILQANGGNVGIGTTDPKGYKLAVAGKVRATEVKVEALPWPDYVFESKYKLSSLPDLDKFIKLNKHLPEIPSAAQVEKEGINLGEMNAKLLKKIEELTLHLIEQDKKFEKKFEEQQKEINQLKSKP